MAQPHEPSQPAAKTYLECLKTLEGAFPALKTFLEQLVKEDDPGRKAVRSHYEKSHREGPGRCHCLIFNNNSVTSVEQEGFSSSTLLRAYLEDNPADQSRKDKKRRLFILEDMEPDYVDALGHHLGVDPLVFSEQMNAWNFSDSWSIPHRGLPSMSVPDQSFTLRYYELRTLFDPKSVNILSWQTSFAINARKYERWRDVDAPSCGKPDRRHAFVRRCASFWTSQDPTQYNEQDSRREELGWDAVILVDPPFTSSCNKPSEVSKHDTLRSDPMTGNVIAPDGTTLSPDAMRNLEECLILHSGKSYENSASLWKAQGLGAGNRSPLGQAVHKSWPYHNGCSTLAPLMFSQAGIGTKEENIHIFEEKRDLTSAMDEMVFYWTKVASQKLIMETNKKSSNAAYYLLKHVAQHWVTQLELMNTTIAKAEWISDDFQARIDDNLSKKKWKADLIKITEIAKDVNYLRRQSNHFWRAMHLNLERLGVQLGSEGVDKEATLALKGAQKDFLTIHTRMLPLRDRAEALGSVSNDLANLRAAFRGVTDGEFSLRLSLFASIVFPLTLIAGIFSMGDDYRPGRPQFFELWAIGLPICVCVAVGLVYGTRPWQVVVDMWLIPKFWWMESEHGRGMKNGGSGTQKKLPAGDGNVQQTGANGSVRTSKRVGYRKPDEENRLPSS